MRASMPSVTTRIRGPAPTAGSPCAWRSRPFAPASSPSSEAMRRAAARAASRRGSSSRMRPLRGPWPRRAAPAAPASSCRRRAARPAPRSSRARERRPAGRGRTSRRRAGRGAEDATPPWCQSPIGRRPAGRRGVGLVMGDQDHRQAGPARLREHQLPASARLSARSSFANGSSSSSIRGSDSIARARATRAFWPPHSVSGSRVAEAARARRASAASAWARRADSAGDANGGMAKARLPADRQMREQQRVLEQDARRGGPRAAGR